jgi:hypothetical protein
MRANTTRLCFWHGLCLWFGGKRPADNKTNKSHPPEALRAQPEPRVKSCCALVSVLSVLFFWSSRYIMTHFVFVVVTAIRQGWLRLDRNAKDSTA